LFEGFDVIRLQMNVNVNDEHKNVKSLIVKTLSINLVQEKNQSLLSRASIRRSSGPRIFNCVW
jgi:hypothetical protein